MILHERYSTHFTFCSSAPEREGEKKVNSPVRRLLLKLRSVRTEVLPCSLISLFVVTTYTRRSICVCGSV